MNPRPAIKTESCSYAILTLSLFFGWLLSFPFHGPVLNIYSESRGLDSGLLAIVFIAFHGGGMLLGGIFIKNSFPWKTLIHITGTLSLAAGMFTLAAPLHFTIPVFALAGASSGSFILAWSVPFSQKISPASRFRVMASIIVAANMIYLAVKFSLLFSTPLLGQGISIASLITAAATAFFLAPSGSWYPHKISEQTQFPALLLAIISAMVFLLYINGGFMYLVLYLSAPRSITWLPIFRDLVYLSVLVSMALVGRRIDRMLPVYTSASLMILAFASYSLFGTTSAGWLSGEILCQSSMGLLDLFLWTVLGDIAFTYKRAYLVFGWGLAANVAGILAGGMIGEFLVRASETPELIIAVSAGITVSLTFLLIPFLATRMRKDLLEKISAFRLGGTLEEYSDAISFPAQSVPGFDQLTPRETEIAGFILRGKGNQQIARELFISENTVKVHLKNIFRKLSIAGKNEFFALVVSAYENERGQEKNLTPQRSISS